MPPSLLSSKEWCCSTSELAQLLSRTTTSSSKDLPPPARQLPIFLNITTALCEGLTRMVCRELEGLTILLHHVTEDSRLPVLLIQGTLWELAKLAFGQFVPSATLTLNLHLILRHKLKMLMPQSDDTTACHHHKPAACCPPLMTSPLWKIKKWSSRRWRCIHNSKHKILFYSPLLATV